jgi:hypothetical protein
MRELTSLAWRIDLGIVSPATRWPGMRREFLNGGLLCPFTEVNAQEEHEARDGHDREPGDAHACLSRARRSKRRSPHRRRSLRRDPKRPRQVTGASRRGRHSYVPTIGGSRHTKASRPPAKGSKTRSQCLVAECSLFRLARTPLARKSMPRQGKLDEPLPVCAFGCCRALHRRLGFAFGVVLRTHGTDHDSWKWTMA